MSKKMIIGIAVVAASLLFLSIAAVTAFKDPETPAQTVMSWHKAALSGDIDETKEYLDSHVLKKLEEGNSYLGSYPSYINWYQKNFKVVKPLEDSLKIIGDTATMNVQITSPTGDKKEEKYLFVKENNRWKIAEN